MSDKKLFTIKTSINKKDYSRFLYIATFLRNKFTIPAIIVITALMAGFVSYNNRTFELKSFLIYLFNYLLFFVGVLSLFLYLLITDLDSFDLLDDFFEEQSNSFKYSVKIFLKFIIHNPSSANGLHNRQTACTTGKRLA